MYDVDDLIRRERFVHIRTFTLQLSLKRGGLETSMGMSVNHIAVNFKEAPPNCSKILIIVSTES